MEGNNRRQQTKGTSLDCGWGLGFLVFMILFGIYTNDASYYSPCTTLSSTYEWSHLGFISMIACFGLQGVLIPILACAIAKQSEGGVVCSSILIIIIRIASAVLNLVVYGGLIYSYQNEDCGDLTNLALGFIIVTSIGLCMIPCLLCLLCCVGIGAATAAGLQAAQGQNQLMANQTGSSTYQRHDDEKQ